MPQAIDLIVQNGAAVNKTFTLISPAAGDGGVAQWALKEGTISAVFPAFTSSSSSKPKGRNLKLKFTHPSSYTDAVTGLTMVNNRAEINISVSIPSDFPEASKNDFVAFCANLINHAFVKSLIRDAVPAT